jgi:hypothetical protein
VFRRDDVTDRAREVFEFVNALNQAWLDGNERALRQRVDAQVIVDLPGLTGRVQGRDAVVASALEFHANTTARRFKAGDWHVDVFADTAVVQYRYSLGYAIGDEEHHDEGHEVLVLVWTKKKRWYVVWRTLLPD